MSRASLVSLDPDAGVVLLRRQVMLNNPFERDLYGRTDAFPYPVEVVPVHSHASQMTTRYGISTGCTHKGVRDLVCCPLCKLRAYMSSPLQGSWTRRMKILILPGPQISSSCGCPRPRRGLMLRSPWAENFQQPSGGSPAGMPCKVTRHGLTSPRCI